MSSSGTNVCVARTDRSQTSFHHERASAHVFQRGPSCTVSTWTSSVPLPTPASTASAATSPRVTGTASLVSTSPRESVLRSGIAVWACGPTPADQRAPLMVSSAEIDCKRCAMGQPIRSRNRNEAPIALSTGTRNAAQSSHRLAAAGRISRAVPLITAAVRSAHPRNALAGCQIPGLESVELVLKPEGAQRHGARSSLRNKSQTQTPPPELRAPILYQGAML